MILSSCSAGRHLLTAAGQGRSDRCQPIGPALPSGQRLRRDHRLDNAVRVVLQQAEGTCQILERKGCVTNALRSPCPIARGRWRVGRCGNRRTKRTSTPCPETRESGALTLGAAPNRHDGSAGRTTSTICWCASTAPAARRRHPRPSHRWHRGSPPPPDPCVGSDLRRLRRFAAARRASSSADKDGAGTRGERRHGGPIEPAPRIAGSPADGRQIAREEADGQWRDHGALM